MILRNSISIVAVIAFILSAHPIEAQSSNEESYPSRDERKEIAQEQIMTLKNGALLVRLQTKERTVNAMLEKGMTKQAQAIKDKVFAENKEKVDAFRSDFNFCPVYFFYSFDSEFVTLGLLDSVGFLNDQLEVDPDLRPETDDYLTAEFTLLAPKDYRDENIHASDDNPNTRNEPKYYGGANMRFHALIMKDEFLDQLDDPFPYYTRTLNSFFLKKKMTEVVSSMNAKLVKYHMAVSAITEEEEEEE